MTQKNIVGVVAVLSVLVLLIAAGYGYGITQSDRENDLRAGHFAAACVDAGGAPFQTARFDRLCAKPDGGILPIPYW